MLVGVRETFSVLSILVGVRETLSVLEVLVEVRETLREEESLISNTPGSSVNLTPVSSSRFRRKLAQILVCSFELQPSYFLRNFLSSKCIK